MTNSPVVTQSWLTNFERGRHVNPSRPPLGARVAVGIHHGSGTEQQVAMLLMAAIDRQGSEPWLWVMDEHVATGITSINDDARAIHDMLDRNSLRWNNVDDWIGDHPSGESRYLVRKSNEQLRKHLAHQACVPLNAFPKISTVRKYHGAVDHALRATNDMMSNAEPRFNINPRAERFAEFCEKFAGDRADPLMGVGMIGCRWLVG